MGQENPFLWVKLAQYNPNKGFLLGLFQPNVGSGSFFPNWEIPIKQQQNPTYFPLFSQFGNCKKFPVRGT